MTIGDRTHRQHRIEEKGIEVGILSHDNARLHIGARKRITRRIEVRNFRAFYVKSSDYHLFLYIKKVLAGQRLRCDQDTKHVLQDWLEGLAANLFQRRHTNVDPTIRKVL